MGLNIGTLSVASNGKISTSSKAGLYKSRTDGSVALKPDGNGKTKRGVSQPADTVIVTNARTGRTFTKAIAKLTDDYDFIADLNKVGLTVTA
jgi:hypothetical protein